MSKLLMPSQKKFFNLGGGWNCKETVEGARGLYHDSVLASVRPKRWYEYLIDTAGMATVYDDNLTKNRAGRSTGPNAHGGRQRGLYWEFLSLPAGNVGDVLVCGKMFKGERFVGGLERHSALTSGGAAATASIGNYSVASDGITLGALIDIDEYLAAADWDAAGGSAFGATHALQFGQVFTTDEFLCITNTTEAFATAGVSKGLANFLTT